MLQSAFTHIKMKRLLCCFLFMAMGATTVVALRSQIVTNTRTCFDKTRAQCEEPFCCWNGSREECVPNIDDVACGCGCKTYDGIIACLDDRNRYCENIVSIGDADTVEECCEFCSLPLAPVDYYVWYSVSQACFCLKTVGQGRIVLHENDLHVSGFMTDNCKLGTLCTEDGANEDVCVDEDLVRVD